MVVKKKAKKSSSKKAAKKTVKKTVKKVAKKSVKKVVAKKPAAPMVKIYSTPTCPWCDRAKQFMNLNGIKYKDINVIQDAQARADMIKKSGQMGVPVIEIGDKIIVGYNEEALRDALNL